MVNDKGDPKIIDFGLSKDTWDNSRTLKTIVGSKVYMAPEVLEGKPHSHPCDMWSLGIILYLMLSGDYPFAGKNLDHDILNEAHDFPKKIWGKVSDQCMFFIEELL